MGHNPSVGAVVLFGAATLLDAATGTRLLAHGVDPARAALGAPDFLHSLHAADVAAGAQWICAATFSATEPDAIREAVQVACMFDVPVMASLGPVGDAKALRKRAEQSLRHGARLISLETYTDDDALCDAIRALDGLPLLASFCPLRGATHAPERFVELGADAIGVNCGDDLTTLIEAAIALTRFGLPVVARPSAGLPDASGEYPVSPSTFAAAVQRGWSAGIQAVGGCCGVAPTHLATARNG